MPPPRFLCVLQRCAAQRAPLSRHYVYDAAIRVADTLLPTICLPLFQRGARTRTLSRCRPMLSAARVIMRAMPRFTIDILALRYANTHTRHFHIKIYAAALPSIFITIAFA